MNFFEHQSLARRNSGVMLLLFLLSVIAIVASVDVVVGTVYSFFDDTVGDSGLAGVPRGADAAGGWLVAGLRAIGMEARALALSAGVLAVAMIVLSIALGRAQARRAIVGTQSQG